MTPVETSRKRDSGVIDIAVAGCHSLMNVNFQLEAPGGQAVGMNTNG
jgi:hypothetical protein